MDAIVQQINSTGKAFIDFALPMLIQSSVLIVVLLGLDIILRKKIRAVFRYWIWMIVLLKLVLPPTLSSPTSVAYWVGDDLRTSAMDRPFSGGRSIPIFLVTDRSVDMPELLETSVTNSTEEEARLENGPAPYITVEAKMPALGLMSSLTWQGYTFLIWLVAVAIMTALLVQRMFFVRRLIAESAEPDDAMLTVLDRARKQMDIIKPIALRISSATTSPSVCGLVRPTILVPQKLTSKLDSGDLKSILLHELAHIKRRDLWISSAQTVVQIVYIYHPLLWVANAIIRKVREQAVDEMVLVAMGPRAEEYPKTLLNISRLAFGRSALSLRLIGVAESKKALIGRIAHITSRPFPTNAKLGLVGFLVVAILCMVLLPMAKGEKSAEGNVPLTSEVKEEPTKSLHKAVNDGDIEQVRLHLSIGTAINAKDQAGWTALHHAASKGYAEIAKLLIAKGANVNARNANGWTPLGYAAMNGRKDVAEVLIAKGADTNARDRWSGQTPIYMAASNGHKEIVKLLLSNGVDVNSGNKRGQTPLEVAMNGNHDEVVELLIANGADISPLHLAIYMKDTAKARNLIEAGADVNKETHYGTTPLHRAVAAGFTDIVKLLIAKGADVNSEDNYGRTPLHEAVFKGHREMVELLVASGADIINSGARSPAEFAMMRGHDDIGELLVAKGADVTPLHFALHQKDRARAISLIEAGADVNRRTLYGTRPIHLAAGAGLTDVAAILIEKGANVNVKTGAGWTPLHHAAYSSKEMVELLISKGANVNANNGDGRSPIWYAERRGNKDIVEVLLANGADANARTGNWTSLHTAAEEGNKDAAELLIAQGVNVNAKDGAGRTALHIAALEDQKEIVELLLQNGVNVNSGAEWNRTAAELAMERGHLEIVELLISKGADISPLHLAIHAEDKAKVKNLIEAGADVNKQTLKGITPLNRAVQRGLKDIAELLIAHGADVNAGYFWSWTSLHEAAEHGQKDMVALLIAKGANVNSKDDDGRTPLWYAQDQGHNEIVELLKKHGAKE